MNAQAPEVAIDEVREVMALMEGLTLERKRAVVMRLQELADGGQLEAYAARQLVGGDG